MNHEIAHRYANTGREVPSVIEYMLGLMDHDQRRTHADMPERESAFFDARRSSYSLVRGWIERAIGEFNRFSDVHDYYDASGKLVLDYGCGEGRLGLSLAPVAAHVTGIDVSAVRIDAARRRAEELGLSGRVDFVVADAHATRLERESFDLIVGANILHHLDFFRALTEIRRLLRPGGRAVFIEPLAHNPILRIGRALTPWARTPDEHPLTADDWSLCETIFQNFRHHERELTTIFFMPLNLVLPRRLQRRLAIGLGRLDDQILQRFPALGKYARLSILILE